MAFLAKADLKSFLMDELSEMGFAHKHGGALSLQVAQMFVELQRAFNFQMMSAV